MTLQLLPLGLLLCVSFSSAQEPAPVGTRLLDLDGDGALDLLAVHADGSLVVRRNVGPRSFQDVAQELPRVSVTEVLCTDLDGDGRLDLYLVSPGADAALLGLGGGRFREATEELGLAESGRGITAERVDVDADGLEDLVLHNQGSDVLFWARPDGRFEREVRTTDGAAQGPVVPVPVGSGQTPPSAVASGADQPEAGSLAPSAGRSGGASFSGAKGAAGAAGGQAHLVVPTLVPPTGGLDARYVNDDQGEVDSADIADGSLTGADVSTTSGDVTFGGDATVTALQGVFGSSSSATGMFSTISGGSENVASDLHSTVSGGWRNSATGEASVVGGGHQNSASRNYAMIGGGFTNQASGLFSTIPGGLVNIAAGDRSFAAGTFAKADHYGSFVWGDSVQVTKTSSADDEFNVYAEGGARIFAVGQTTPSLVVDATGRVGIGTGTPFEPLTVATPVGRGFVQRAGTVAVGTYANASGGWYGTFSNHDLVFFVNNSFGDAVLTTSGNLGIGTLSPSFKLEVNGSAGKPGGGSWSVSSDRRLKKNVRDLEGALETLLKLRGVTFEYKDPEAVHELPGERIGFIAQEVEEVLPDWVEETGGYKRLTIRGFEALAVEALRTQQAEIEALQSQVAELEGLRAELAALTATHGAAAAR